MTTRPPRVRTGQHLFPLIGSFVGLATWSLFALMPSLVYGGFAGWSLAHGVLGGHAGDGGFVEEASVAFGMLVGGLGVASVFVVLGAVLGAGVWALKEAVFRAVGLRRVVAPAEGGPS